MGANPLATADVQRRATKALENHMVDMGTLMEVNAETYLTQKEAWKRWEEEKDAVKVG
jgi:hypothetical protein